MKVRPDIWLVGLPLAALIWGAAVWRLAPEIEADLRREVQADAAAIEGGRLGRAGARIDVEGRELTITAEAPLSVEGQADADRLRRAIAGLRGPTVRVLGPASVQLFTFTLTRSGDELVLSGFVPPGSLRAELLDEARQAADSVRDDLRSALGAPAGFDEVARLLLRGTRRLEQVSASLTGLEVSVSGTAPDTRTYREATDIVRVLPPGYSPGQIDIKPPLVRPYSWSATREGGSLKLAGHIPSEAERRNLLAMAAGLGGGLQVEDRMETARGLEPGLDFGALTKQAGMILRDLESGRVALEGRALTITGRLAARDLLDSLQGQIRQEKLPGVELERVVLEPVVPRPYRFTARRKDGRVHLAGFVAAEADRAAIRALVQRRFPFDAVRDELRLADGAPEGLMAAGTAALEHLSALAEGEATIEDNAARISGRALYPGIAERTQRGFAKAVPPNWTARADVSAIPDKPLDLDFCGDLISDAVRRDPIRFEPGKAELGPAVRGALAGLADIMRRCGTARLLVNSGAASTGEAEFARALAERRAGRSSRRSPSTGSRLGCRRVPKGSSRPRKRRTRSPSR
jgi:outer membrane protein OmpA-like peptidoglycan-associated protein